MTVSCPVGFSVPRLLRVLKRWMDMSIDFSNLVCRSETNDVNTGLLVEVWSKGMLWDRALGYHYIPLPGVSYASEVTTAIGSRGDEQEQRPQGINDGNSSVALPRQRLSVELSPRERECNSSRDQEAPPQALTPHNEETRHASDTITDTNSNTQEYDFTDTVHLPTLHGLRKVNASIVSRLRCFFFFF